MASSIPHLDTWPSLQTPSDRCHRFIWASPVHNCTPITLSGSLPFSAQGEHRFPSPLCFLCRCPYARPFPPRYWRAVKVVRCRRSAFFFPVPLPCILLMHDARIAAKNACPWLSGPAGLFAPIFACAVFVLCSPCIMHLRFMSKSWLIWAFAHTQDYCTQCLRVQCPL